MLANRIDEDYIAVDARSGAVVIELFVDSIAGRCRGRGRGCCRGPQGHGARTGVHGEAEKTGRQLSRPAQEEIESRDSQRRNECRRMGPTFQGFHGSRKSRNWG